MILSDSVSTLAFVGPVVKERLEKLNIYSVEDLLLHVPTKYLDFSRVLPINKARVGDTVTIKGTIESMKNQYTKTGKRMQIAQVADDSGEILAIWFNQPYLIRILYKGVAVSLAGKIEWFGRTKAIISPEFEKVEDGKGLVHTGQIVPVYPETKGLTSKFIRRIVTIALANAEPELSEFLPEETLKNLSLSQFRKATYSVHIPGDLEEGEAGRKRLAFNELLFLQAKNTQRRIIWRSHKAALKVKIVKDEVESFIKSLPFILTFSQKKSVGEILSDFDKTYPGNRLLEGDVGSGKTVVAAIAAFVCFANGYQTVFMAPTQILAQQHFNTLNTLFKPFKVRVSLITSEVTKSDVGRADLFVGTHALIHQKLDFDKVALVVIDEQHRFGVEQRAHLVRTTGKDRISPHVLTMTATPIPRTVALTLYGDLDLSLLTELPTGRKKIVTWIVPSEKREGAYGWIKSQITVNKSQVFIVCPLIEESDKESMASIKNVTSEFEKLKKVFSRFDLGLLHGRMKAEEKNKVLSLFKKGNLDILVATPVVEVGIDVPNAGVMVIENAGRFGLSQLHQLRGRVGRSDKKSYCLLFSEERTRFAEKRLNALTSSYSGFELAELDLKLRGPGEVFGTAQHGFPDLKIASWQDIDLIKSAKVIAEEAFANPQKFSKFFDYLRRKQIIAN